MSVLTSLSAYAAGIPSQLPAATTTSRASDRFCMSVSFVSGGDAGRRPVVRCRIAQLPNLRRAQFVDRLVDQIQGLVVIGGVEVGAHIVHHLWEAAAGGHLVADAVPVVQGGLSVGK